MSKEETKVVPPRNDPNPLEPYSRSRALELAGRDPGFHYEWKHPSDVATHLRPQEIGDQFTGYLMIDPWEVVDDRQGVTQGRGRADAGKAVDTTVTNGELVLMRTTQENAAKYRVIEQRRDRLIDQRLYKGERVNLPGGSNFKTRTVGGRDGLSIDPNDALQGAGV